MASGADLGPYCPVDCVLALRRRERTPHLQHILCALKLDKLINLLLCLPRLPPLAASLEGVPCPGPAARALLFPTTTPVRRQSLKPTVPFPSPPAPSPLTWPGSQDRRERGHS